jgi:DNA-binding NarL/FixJ family response regulator
MSKTPILIAIVEDDADIRAGLGSLIEAAPGFELVGSFHDGEDMVNGFSGAGPDVILMDINMPRMDGIECTRRLKAVEPAVQIMMLTMYEDDESIFASLKAGASGYLVKTTPPHRILESIRELVSGGSPMSSSIARKVVGAFHQSPAGSAEMESLSAREREILDALARGFRYKEVAERLFISPETVRTHVHRIYEKLHVRSRTEAVVKYLRT